MRRPLPSHSGQATWRMNSPRMPRETCWRTPTPLQRGHAMIVVPGAAPFPPHVWQVAAVSSGTSTVLPFAASTSPISTSAMTSAPRALPPRRRPVPKRSSPKNALKRSPKLPRSKWLGWKPPERSPACP